MEDDIAHHISSFFHPAAPHFFKIVLQETIRTGKLVVPKKFVRKYGKDLSVSSVVLLKVPSGDAWEVELRKGDTDVWLQKGWLDFANFYSIKHGHFLVFKYEAGSSNVFNVFVFDKSATEIEYPVRSKVTLSSIKVENIDEDSDNIPVKKRNTRPISGIMTRSRTRLTGHSRMPENGRRASGGGATRSKLEWCSGAAAEDRGNNSSLDVTKAKERQKIVQDFEFQPVNGFVPGQHPVFQMVMTKGCLSKGYLKIATTFMKENIDLKHKKQRVTLKADHEDRSWTITLITGLNPRPWAMFSGGFMAFLKENSLKAGDVCTFELIGRAEMVFRVSISRVKQ
ncbi:hypothetical protein CDL15_Pgr013521 [Punica granatum]|uniref:TF-B3 domain-containing protein n=1 Tax=Punica granatum TaxID=22663 RepID=A0A218W0E8_PUNGR|nr:hypothetical protein CDL15_Pgr013521 [Punica granatum]PKI48440.1 hypothetical protein CRG98_031166 [Punica granatum]